MNQNNSKTTVRKKNTYIAIYAFGAIWFIFGFIFPPIFVGRILINTTLALIGGTIVYMWLPVKDGLNPLDITFGKTGVAEVDGMLEKGRSFNKEIYDLSEKLSGTSIYPMTKEISSLSMQILKQVEKNPDQYRTTSSFTDYYFPTTLKLMHTYDEINSQPAKSESMLETTKKIEGAMSEIVKAYKNQLDNLFENRALDIKTDIQVLDSMLKKDGLNDDNSLSQ